MGSISNTNQLPKHLWNRGELRQGQFSTGSSDGYIGMVAGIAATEYLNAVAGKQTMDAGMFSETVFLNPTINISIAIQATMTLVIAGTLAGFFPARKAVMIRPIEALRAD